MGPWQELLELDEGPLEEEEAPEELDGAPDELDDDAGDELEELAKPPEELLDMIRFLLRRGRRTRQSNERGYESHGPNGYDHSHHDFDVVPSKYETGGRKGKELAEEFEKLFRY